VTGLAVVDTSWAVICCRAHERFANSAPMISGVLEKTIARRNPSRCKMRSNRSSKLTPHNSVNASGASATKIGRTFSIASEINGGAARCQLPAAFQLVWLLFKRDLRDRTSRAAWVADDDVVVFRLAEGREKATMAKFLFLRLCYLAGFSESEACTVICGAARRARLSERMRVQSFTPTRLALSDPSAFFKSVIAPSIPAWAAKRHGVL
jgi:hypothetical protein